MTGRATPDGAVAALRRLAATAREERRAWLYEPEALEVAAALGVRSPQGFVVIGPSFLDQAALARLGTPQVVVKGLAPGVVHKARRGWVRVAAAEVAEVAAAMAAMGTVGPAPAAFLIQERVEFSKQWLLGLRDTAEFGPVVTLGPGGARAELLARAAPEQVTIVPAIGGAAAVPGPEALARLVRRVAELAAAAPGEVAEFEINPVVLTPDPVALDAVLRLGSPAAPAAVVPRPVDKLVRLLEPRSLAVVGVSRGVNAGRLILRNVLRAGLPPEDVVVVKPGVDQIEGVRCVPDLEAPDGPVDLLVLSVAAAQVPELMERVVKLECAESVILIPGGLGERPGSEAAAGRVRAAIDQARALPGRGPLVVGGNCLGVRSRPGRYDTFFIPPRKLSRGPRHEEPAALVAQSGAFILSALDRLPWLAPRYAVSVGNQIDLTVGDFVDHFAGTEVEVVGCYVEGFRPGDGTRFLDAVRRLRRQGRCVVLYRAGRTAAGAGAAASHTAAIAGDYAVTRALAAGAGALVAETLADFTDLLMLAVLLRRRRVAGLGLGAVSNAGFETVAMADGLGPLHLADLAPATVARLGAVLDGAGLTGLVEARNPLDVTPVAPDAAFAEAAAAVLAAPAVDVGLVGCVPFTGALETLAAADGHDEDLASRGSVASRLVELATDKAWAAVVDGGEAYDPMARYLQMFGIPTFRQADRAVRLLGRYAAWRVGRGS